MASERITPIVSLLLGMQGSFKKSQSAACGHVRTWVLAFEERASIVGARIALPCAFNVTARIGTLITLVSRKAPALSDADCKHPDVASRPRTYATPLQEPIICSSISARCLLGRDSARVSNTALRICSSSTETAARLLSSFLRLMGLHGSCLFPKTAIMILA